MNDADIVIGINPIRELLHSSPKKIIKIFSTQDKSQGNKKELLQALQRKNIPITFKDKHSLSKIAGSESHQGFVALIQPRKFLSIDAFLQSKRNTKCLSLVLLDGITDPQNVGAILRAAECFQIDGVIIPKALGCSITATVSKASAGALDLIPIIQVNNALSAVIACKKAKLSICSFQGGKEAKSLSAFSIPERSLLILGSEGKGVSKAILDKSDHQMMIPMHGSIDSLNVSQAAAILFHTCRDCSK